MHKTKIEFLRTQFKEENCFSALITTGLDSMIAGTPAIVSISPFRKANSPSTYSNSLTFAKVAKSNPHDTYPSGSSYNRPSKGLYTSSKYYSGKHRGESPESDIEKVTAKDLYEMDIEEANKLLHFNGAKANIMFPFSFYEDLKDYYIYRMNGNQLYFNGEKPLIFDEGHILETERLSDIHSKTEIQNFVEMVNDSLRSNRYLNYVFNNVATSNKKYMLEDINTIFNSLKKFYPKNVSFFRTPIGKSLRCLIDTISISFYRIEDVIAIFDSRRASGIAVEIFLTNSTHDASNISRDGNTVTYRFLFSKFRENLFTIDGELIRRKYDRDTRDVLLMASSVISRDIPNDEKLKKEKSKTVST